MFHSSAILFSLYFFLNRDIKRSLLFVILIIAFILGKTSLPFMVFSFAGENIGGMGSTKALYYADIFKEELAEKNLSLMGLIKRILFISIFMYNYATLSSKLVYYRIIFNGYYIGLIIYFLFSSSILILVNRGSLYFTVMEALLLSSQFLLLKNKHYKVNFLLVLFVVCIFLFFQSIAGYPDLYIPYKGIFINSEYSRFRID
jgi:hypothetical protein